MPTLIHVYIFTILFIFYGAIKSKSKYGICLGGMLLLIPFVICYIPIHYNPSPEALSIFRENGITYLSLKVAETLDQLKNGEFYMLSEVGIRIQIFIAFAYTYHYLNWFSKISVIDWRKAITKKRHFNSFYMDNFDWDLCL